MGSIPTLVRVFLCPCVGPVPSVGLTLTWFIWDRNLALHVTLHSRQLHVREVPFLLLFFLLLSPYWCKWFPFSHHPPVFPCSIILPVYLYCKVLFPDFLEVFRQLNEALVCGQVYFLLACWTPPTGSNDNLALSFLLRVSGFFLSSQSIDMESFVLDLCPSLACKQRHIGF